jgi:hypothetical protein
MSVYSSSKRKALPVPNQARGRQGVWNSNIAPGMPHLDNTCRSIVSFMPWATFSHVKVPPPLNEGETTIKKFINLCQWVLFSGMCLLRSGVLQYTAIIIIIIIKIGEGEAYTGFGGET